MKLNYLLLITLCVTLIACNTETIDAVDEEIEEIEEVEETEETTDNNLIKRIVYNKDTAEEYTDTFNYDGNKLTSVDYGDGYKNVFVYDEKNNIVKDEYYSENVLAAYTVLEYDTENKLTKFTETFLEPSGLDDRQYENVFTYNNDGTITKEVYVDYSNSGFELSWTETIIFNNKNITNVKDNDDSTEYIYTYDDKKGMFENIYAIEILNQLSENEFGPYIYGNTNNITSNIEKYENHESGDLTEYTYGDDGYPETALYKSIYDGVIDEDQTETIDFFYE